MKRLVLCMLAVLMLLPLLVACGDEEYYDYNYMGNYDYGYDDSGADLENYGFNNMDSFAYSNGETVWVKIEEVSGSRVLVADDTFGLAMKNGIMKRCGNMDLSGSVPSYEEAKVYTYDITSNDKTVVDSDTAVTKGFMNIYGRTVIGNSVVIDLYYDIRRTREHYFVPGNMIDWSSGQRSGNGTYYDLK